MILTLGRLDAAEPSTTSTSATVTNPIVVPFEFRREHIMVPARVNDLGPLSFLLDTGYGMTMLNAAHAESLALPRRGSITIVGIAGESPAAVFEGPTFDFTGTTWRPRRVAALPPEGRSRRRDGILGSGFFRRYVVEINPWEKHLRLHEPSSFEYSGPGEILPLTFKGSTPIVAARVRLADQTVVEAQFEIDTGCDSALCIGQPFAEAHSLLSTNNAATGNRVGVGGGTRTKAGHLPALQLGRLIIEKPSANFFLEGSPVDPPLAGHIGLELLRAYKVTFDYARKRMILETKR
jgi:hypothetical protein